MGSIQAYWKDALLSTEYASCRVAQSEEWHWCTHDHMLLFFSRDYASNMWSCEENETCHTYKNNNNNNYMRVESKHIKQSHKNHKSTFSMCEGSTCE